MTKNKRKSGFTFVELIVTVTIIALLTAITIVSFASATAKARDGRRMADLEKIRMALEEYRQTNSTYPPPNPVSGSVANVLTAALVPGFLPQMPSDPKASSNFIYFYSGTAYTYTLDAYLESNAADPSILTTCSTGSPAINCNYRVTNP